ncbi:MAG: hypothetical protein IPK81_10040 [Rhodospirillales bacterium]|nr:MAG: hypothetical protein IPK81_10040 [Rhodospirillales bacterium]
MRLSNLAALAVALAAAAAPAAAGDCPGAVRAEEFACFGNAGAADLVLRVEWPDGRWALHAHPAGRKLRLHIGVDDAVACWSPLTGAGAAAVERCAARGRPVMKGCDGAS